MTFDLKIELTVSIWILEKKNYIISQYFYYTANFVMMQGIFSLSKILINSAFIATDILLQIDLLEAI